MSLLCLWLPQPLGSLRACLVAGHHSLRVARKITATLCGEFFQSCVRFIAACTTSSGTKQLLDFFGLTCAWRAVAGSQTRPLSAAEVGGRVPPGWSPSPAARGPSLSLPTGYVDPTSPSLRSRARRPRPDGLVDIEVGAAVVAPALPTSPTFWTPWRSAPRQAVAQPSRRAVAQQHDTAVLRCSIFYLRQTTYQDA